MTVNVTYSGRYGWGHPKNPIKRPYAEIVFPGPKGYLRLWALVDTGADYLQLDNYWARSIGINPASTGAPLPVTLASGGTLRCYLVKGITVEIESKRVVVDCLFASTPSATPILGRIALLAAIDVGFDVKGWMFKV